MLLRWCHQLLSGFLANSSLLRVSHVSPNDKGGNEMKLGAVPRYPGIYLTAEVNPGKPRQETV